MITTCIFYFICLLTTPVQTISPWEVPGQGNINDNFFSSNDFTAFLEVQDANKLGFKSALIRYDEFAKSMAGSNNKTVELHIGGYGAKQASFIEETTENSFVKQKEMTKSHIVTTSEYIITYTLGEDVAYRIKNIGAAMLKGMTKADAEKFARQMQDAMDAKTEKIDSRTFDNQVSECHRTIAKLGTLETITEECWYKGFLMYSSSSVMGTETKREVTSFKENYPFDPAVMQFDVKIVDKEIPGFRN